MTAPFEPTATGPGCVGPVAVLALGNVLMGDDGLGPHVLRRLVADWDLPPEVEVHDLGTPGLDLAPWLMDVKAAILVDTVKADAPPGTIRTYAKERLATLPAALRMSPHDPALVEVLSSLELAGHAPRDLVLVGVVPRSVEQGIGLSDPVRAAIPAAVEAVVVELRRFGVEPERRSAPAETKEEWWTAP